MAKRKEPVGAVAEPVVQLSSVALRLHARFPGLERAHGHSRPEGAVRASDGKQPAFSETIHAPATVALWQGHLDGVYGVGIIPIRDDATCRWGAIDIDVDRKPNLPEVVQQVDKLGLPIIVCRSKSGGAHLFLFTTEDVPAEMLRGKLMEWAVALGYSGVEVFPKQTRLAGPRDFGNWINMPYFAGATTNRYALSKKGDPLSVVDFLNAADALAVTKSELDGIGMPTDMTFEGALEGAPPCLQSIAGRGGAGEGNRNNMLFNLAVYAKKRFGDEFEEHLDVYNGPPFLESSLGHKEVSSVSKSHKRKEYEYKCNEGPIAQVCNRQICLTRKYGVGQGESDPGVVFGTLVKLETMPPVWIWDVDGARLELTTEQLKDQGRFHTACIEVLNKWPRLVKPQDWATMIRRKLENVEVVPVPPDARPDGQMWAHLQNYCTGRVRAKTRDELLLDKPWIPTKADVDRYGKEVTSDRIYFRSSHFKTYLEQQRMTGVNERKLWAWLRDRDAKHHSFNINGRYINVWSVPIFPEQIEPHLVPRMTPEEM
jgi:hypothetical protein